MIKKSKLLMSALRQRLEFHISGQVDKRRWYHWTFDFVRDNFAPMAAAMCLFGHIADDLNTYAMYERLLLLLKENMLETGLRSFQTYHLIMSLVSWRAAISTWTRRRRSGSEVAKREEMGKKRASVVVGKSMQIMPQHLSK